MKRGALRLLAGAASFLKRHGLVLAAGAVALLASAAVMTGGAFDLLTRGAHFSDFYDQLGRSILHGRFDVPPGSIGLEAFVIGGRTYGYFGPTPALLRIPLDLVCPSMWGRWTRVVMLAAVAASLLAAHAVHRHARRALGRPPGSVVAEQAVAAAFVLATGLGTTLLFIARRPILYHEAIAVAAAFALGGLAMVLRYIADRKLRHLVLSVVFTVLAVLARASVGTGALLALGGLACALLVRGSRRHLALLLALLALGGAAIAFRNLRTLGNLSGEPPLDRHIAIMKDPVRLARTGGRFVHPENLRTLAYNYLRPDGVILRGRFPWFSPKPGATARRFPEAHLDNAEPFVSLPAVYPVWLVLAVLGLLAAFGPSPGTPETSRADDRQASRLAFRLAILGSAAGCAGPLVAVYLTLRYLHDLFPFLVVTSALGLEWLLALAARRTSARIGLAAVVLLAIYSCLASIGVTLATVRWA